MTEQKVLFFKYKNSKYNPHAIEDELISIKYRESIVYIPNKYRQENNKIIHGSVCLCEVSKVSGEVIKRGNVFYKFSYVNLVKVLVPGEVVKQREKNVKRLHNKYGVQYPYSLKDSNYPNSRNLEDDYIIGFVDYDYYLEEIVNNLKSNKLIKRLESV